MPAVVRAEGEGRPQVAAHRKADSRLLRRRLHRPARRLLAARRWPTSATTCSRPRSRCRKTYGFVTPRDRHFENAAAVGLHEAPGDHRAAWPSSWVRTCSCGGRRCSTSRPRRRPFSSTRPARSWSRTTRTRPCTRPIATKSSSSPCGSPSTTRPTRTAASTSSAARTARMRTIKFGGEEGFYNAAFSLEYDREPKRSGPRAVQERASSSSSWSAASTARRPTRPTATAWRSTCG